MITVVGLIKSPNCLNYERGTTALLDGVADCFIYVPREAMDSDIYTEVYLRMEERHLLYSEEYDAYLESVSDMVKTAAEEAGDRRRMGGDCKTGRGTGEKTAVADGIS